jgi:predicted nicotinamide N-methyase
MHDESIKEEIWEQASLRLSERSGRSAMPAMSRKFRIPKRSGRVDLSIHEPALTEDNLGLKTWAASYMLSKRLHTFKLPQVTDMLELGSGTGLVGIAAAAVFGCSVLLTDLAEITPNLSRNVEDSRATVRECGGSLDCGILDWSKPHSYRPFLSASGLAEGTETGSQPDSVRKYPVILAADSLYSPEHPRLLVQTIEAWLSPEVTSRVIVEFPIREAYRPELSDFKRRMDSIGLAILEEGEETGYDDWASEGGRSEVRCWWSIWGRITQSNGASSPDII